MPFNSNSWTMTDGWTMPVKIRHLLNFIFGNIWSFFYFYSIILQIIRYLLHFLKLICIQLLIDVYFKMEVYLTWLKVLIEVTKMTKTTLSVFTLLGSIFFRLFFFSLLLLEGFVFLEERERKKPVGPVALANVRLISRCRNADAGPQVAYRANPSQRSQLRCTHWPTSSECGVGTLRWLKFFANLHPSMFSRISCVV